MNRFTTLARRLAVAVGLLAVALGGNARAADVAPAPAAEGDSLSMALATTFGIYLRPSLVNSYGEDAAAMKAYSEGVATAFTTEPSREPYYRGVLEGMQLADRLARMRQLGVEANLSDFLTSMRQYLVSGVAPMTDEAAQGIINRAIAEASHRAADTLSLADEQRFLDAQFDRPGVVKLESGLLFEVLVEGEGVYPTMDSAVLVSYTGRLSDGTVFDHTDEPITLDVAHVVAGMQEGLLMMKPGGRYRLFIPSWLGYGPEGIPGIIPGNAVLDFTIDLISVGQSQLSE
ncbi:MAG: FKBP-type peptidyl-prolyl cis-trans isomerase [Muribaculaceae bacterium]|nr:FKBP-type peptidyl-prolyl cis-trans isomerase [Muribaculaceae bacterium]